MINGLPQNLNYLMHSVDALMNTMHRKPEVNMRDEHEYDAKLQALADKYFPDEMAELFSDPGSIREAIGEMSDVEIELVKSTSGLIQKACLRYFTPIAKKSALKRAEQEMEELGEQHAS